MRRRELHAVPRAWEAQALTHNQSLRPWGDVMKLESFAQGKWAQGKDAAEISSAASARFMAHGADRSRLREGADQAWFTDAASGARRTGPGRWRQGIGRHAQLHHYMQRTALQGSPAMLTGVTGSEIKAPVAAS